MAKAPDIIFIYPSQTVSGVSLGYNFGSSSLIALLRTNGFKADAMILANPDLNTVAERLKELKPRVVGLTCYDNTFHIVRCLIKIISEVLPYAWIVVGGPTGTYSSQLLFDTTPEIDITVQGEGELSMLKLLILRCKSIALDPDNLSKIPGISYRTGKRVLSNGRPQLIRNLNSLPSAILSNVIPPLEAGPIGVMLNRGCNHKCIYCAFAAMSYHTVRTFSPIRVCSELKHIKDNCEHEQSISFLDDNFLASKQSAIDLCTLLEAKKIKLKYFCQLRSEVVDRQMLEVLYKAGFRKIAFGLESNSPRLLKVVKKNLNYAVNDKNGREVDLDERYIRSIETNIKYAKDLGIEPVVSAMIGLPGETQLEAQQLLDFLNYLPLDPGQIALNCLYVACGTELYARRGEFNLKVKDVSKTSVSRLYETNLPEYTKNLRAMPKSISYIQRRHQTLLLKERLQSILVSAETNEISREFMLVSSLASAETFLIHATMSTTIYIVGDSFKEVDHLSKKVSSYLIRNNLPISLITEVIVQDYRQQSFETKPITTLGQLDGPIRVIQFTNHANELLLTHLIDHMLDIDLLLVICETQNDVEVALNIMKKSLTTIVSLSAYPLVSNEGGAKNLLSLSQMKFKQEKWKMKT